MRCLARYLKLLIFVVPLTVFAPWNPVEAGTPVTLYQSFAGSMSFVGTGGTLRSQPDAVNPCSLTPTSTSPVSGIPGTATITAAYLYWAGSGSAGDYTVTFDGLSVTADRTFVENYAGTYDFFSGFKDVTAQIAAKANPNVNYTFSGLTVNSGNPYCGVNAVLSGWGLLIVYEDASEPLRVINVFDGFQYFRGSSVTLTPANFRIPAVPPIDGAHGVLTWEGDVGNSASLGGFSENLTFNGTALPQPPTTTNPANSQFNSTINVLSPFPDTYYGVDLDVYDVTSLLGAGDTSATSVYSSGGDLVLLSMEVLSVTNDPVADLAISKSHVGDFTVGQNGVYTVAVNNNGPNTETGTITVTDTLPAGLTYVSGTGTGWSCGVAGQDVTCTHAGPLASGASLPDITLTVSVGVAAVGGVTNTAAVVGTLFDNQAANDSSSDPTTILSSDLSTSTKTVVDLNGGEVDPGDTLRYTITLIETGGLNATGVSVIDNLPTNTTGISIVSFPTGATNASTPTLVDISSFTVVASSSETIVFDVTVLATANPGDFIDNTATITNPDGIGATAVAPTLTVSPSLQVSGIKNLYFGAPDNQNNPSQPQAMSRTPLIATPAVPRIRIRRQDTRIWAQTPATQASLSLSAGVTPVVLQLRRNGNNSTRNIRVTLDYIGAATGTLGFVDVSVPGTGPTGLNNNNTRSFTFPVPTVAVTLPVGTQIRVNVDNEPSVGPTGQAIFVYPYDGATGNTSQVQLNATTVINVNSVVFYDAAYPGGNAVPGVAPSQAVYVRAVISDPFGAFDITSATVAMTAGPCTIGSAVMTEIVALATASTKTYESVVVNTAVATPSTCTASVTGNEGSEGTVSHTRNANLLVGNPSLTILKSVSGVSKPGQTLTYSIAVANTGNGYTNSMGLTDIMSPYTAFGLTALPPSTAPFTLSDGVPCGTASGITFGTPEYANDRPPTYAYVPGVTGWDGAITAWRMQPMTGSMNPGSCFTMQYQAQVK